MERDPDRGQRVRDLYEKRGMSRTAAATRVGVSPNAYKAWEQGGILDWPNVERLAAAFNVSTDYIMTGRDEPVTPDLVSEIRSALKQRETYIAQWREDRKIWADHVNLWRKAVLGDDEAILALESVTVATGARDGSAAPDTTA